MCRLAHRVWRRLGRAHLPSKRHRKPQNESRSITNQIPCSSANKRHNRQPVVANQRNERNTQAGTARSRGRLGRARANVLPYHSLNQTPSWTNFTIPKRNYYRPLSLIDHGKDLPGPQSLRRAFGRGLAWARTSSATGKLRTGMAGWRLGWIMVVPEAASERGQRGTCSSASTISQHAAWLFRKPNIAECERRQRGSSRRGATSGAEPARADRARSARRRLLPYWTTAAEAAAGLGVPGQLDFAFEAHAPRPHSDHAGRDFGGGHRLRALLTTNSGAAAGGSAHAA